ncbi:unnamed protein product [Coregonus sp. 'balchen']|nr:unnamed protein product [Coregonus sp. 'balchen']
MLGATAIEDKLQDGVPQTIEQLAKADIKIWVLTGDKQETAENIGYSCNMLREEMNDIFIVSANNPDDVRQELRNAWSTMKPGAEEAANFMPERTLGNKPKVVRDEEVNGEYGLIINGHSLAFALERSMELLLLRTACLCKTVICCRVTPLQKAQVVELVKKYKQAEGMQAVLSSDYSFAQFRFLERLLLVHGRWSYLRMCKFLRYFFYKNFTFTFVHFWYAFFCGFSAQTVYDEWFITLYNLVYTALPVLGMSLFDQDVNDMWSSQHPQLYIPGQMNQYFSKTAFFKCSLHSVYSSVVLFFIPFAAMCDTLGLDLSYWTAVNQFFVWGSLAMYFTVTFTMYSNGTYLISPASFPFIGTARNSLNQPNVWLTILLTAILCVLPVVAYRFLLIQLRPTINDKVMFKVRQAKAAPPPPARRARIRRTSSRRSGYAFSHAAGYGDLVTSNRFLRRPAVTRSTAFTPLGRTTGFSPTGRSAGYSPTGNALNSRPQDVELEESINKSYYLSHECVGLGRYQYECVGLGRYQYECVGPGRYQYECVGLGRYQYECVGLGRYQHECVGLGRYQYECVGLGRYQYKCVGLGRYQHECVGLGRYQYECVGLGRYQYECVGLGRYQYECVGLGRYQYECVGLGRYQYEGTGVNIKI